MRRLLAISVLLALAALACAGGSDPTDYRSFVGPQWDTSNEVGKGLKVENCYGGYFNVTWGGTLDNLTDFTLANVKLGLELMKGNEVVATDSIIAVGEDGLASGKQTRWEGIARFLPTSWDYCYVKVLDYAEVR